jgi:nucleolar GTP-binding protein
MGFSDLPPIEHRSTYLDNAFKKARLKAREHSLAEVNKSQIQREKTLAIVKITSIRDYLVQSFDKIISAYPNFDNLTEFYTQLLKLTVDYHQLKKSLGALSWVNSKIISLSTDSIRRIKRGSSVETIGGYLKQYYGRISSILKQIDEELVNLHNARHIMRDFPSVKDEFTVAIAGFPNVGKSTLLSQLTPARPEINSYAFTTKKLNQGYIKDEAYTIQCIDTPGTLNRPERMNIIEKIAYLAMKYLANYIVYIFDLTEDAYSLRDQLKLLETIKRYNKPIVCYLSKTDLISSEQIDGFKEIFSRKKIPLFIEESELKDYLLKSVRER